MTARLQAVAAVAVALAAGSPSAVEAQENSVPFIDEAAEAPEFATFRRDLVRAVLYHDADSIVAAAASDIVLDFGGGSGPDEFRARIDASIEAGGRGDAPYADYLAELAEALRLGGEFIEAGLFEAPYTWTAPLPEDADAFSVFFVTATGVPVHKEPAPGAEVTGSLSYELVDAAPYDEQPDTPDYLLVEARDGRVRGYVAHLFLRSPVDYRLGFEETEAGWRIVFFIAGD